LTRVTGMLEGLEKQVEDGVAEMRMRFTGVETRLDGMERTLEGVENELAAMRRQLNDMEESWENGDEQNVAGMVAAGSGMSEEEETMRDAEGEEVGGAEDGERMEE
jgi:hypothetical protein